MKRMSSYVGIDLLKMEIAQTFYNRKLFYSINIQMICGARMRFLNIVARWPGSTHGVRIFNNSNIKRQFENNKFGNHYLIGDSAYPCRHYILTPFLRSATAAKARFNNYHGKTR